MRSINTTDCWAVFNKMRHIAVAGFDPQTHIKVFGRICSPLYPCCNGIAFGFGYWRASGRPQSAHRDTPLVLSVAPELEIPQTLVGKMDQ